MFGQREAQHFAEFNAAGRRRPALEVLPISCPLSQAQFGVLAALVNLDSVSLLNIKETFVLVKTYVANCLQNRD